jgi:threonine dehydrogenase-like Zn-dependent dehydrogenase
MRRFFSSTDILPTGYTAIEWSKMTGGETVAVFDCGPVGLMPQKVAWLKGAKRVIGVALQPYRLQTAERVAGSEIINIQEEDAVERIRDMTDGRGADVCMDAVGMEADRSTLDKIGNVFHLQKGSISALNMAVSPARRGGVVSASVSTDCPVTVSYVLCLTQLPPKREPCRAPKGVLRLSFFPRHRQVSRTPNF